MVDLTQSLLPQIHQRFPSSLNIGCNCIFPAYEGSSVLNIPASICQSFQIPGIAGNPLQSEILAAFTGPVQRVLLILMDGLSLHRFQRWLGEGRLPVWEHLIQNGLLAPLTSLIPSTTSTALTSLWTGRSAAEHGIAGYELWLKEYGVVANMILQAPITFQNSTGSLEKAGFQPENYLPFPSLGTYLAAHNIRTYAFQHHSIAQSGLSRLFLQNVTIQGVATGTDLWLNVRDLILDRPAEKQYIWVYWGELDHFSHHFGPDNEYPAFELELFSQAFERIFCQANASTALKNTLILLTADHGQIATPKDPHYDLRNHPDLLRQLSILPTGENRLVYLYPRAGQSQAIHDYIEHAWPGQFHALNPSDALQRGLFGPGKIHPKLLDRLGDLILLPQNSAYLWWAEKENHLLGRHGGASPDEMIVPFVAALL